MTDLERYLFDLQGFIVVENALTRQQIQDLKSVLDRQIEKRIDKQDKKFLRFDSLLGWGKPFQNLIDNPAVTPYLQELLGEGFRLDHDYVHTIYQGKGPVGSFLHGGATPYDPCQYYLFKDGRMLNGLTAVAYELNDVYPGEGGFACIPGSHKSNYPFPREWLDLSNPASCVQGVAVKAGSAIIFTEALTHGTLPWRGKNSRQTIFYKYSPQSSGWARYYYKSDDFPGLTDSQRRILRVPGLYP
jgi:hypothetical protein